MTRPDATRQKRICQEDCAAARPLVGCLPDLLMLFEAPSTDYQTPAPLACLVQDGFAIPKLGPGLTYALREALCGLDHTAFVLCANRPDLLRASVMRVLQRYFAACRGP